MCNHHFLDNRSLTLRYVKYTKIYHCKGMTLLTINVFTKRVNMQRQQQHKEANVKSLPDLGFEHMTSGTAVRCVDLKVIEATDNEQFRQQIVRATPKYRSISNMIV